VATGPAAASVAGARSHHAGRNAGAVLAALHLPAHEAVVFGVAHVAADIDEGSIRQAVAYRPRGLMVTSHLDVSQVKKRYGGGEPSRIVDRR
jgi:hypothetical protein